MKTCPSCEIEKDESLFNKDKYTKNGLRRICKECDNWYRKQYNSSEHGKKKNKEYAHSKRGKEVRKGIDLKYNFGITLDKHKEMYIKQNGHCLLCGRLVDYRDVVTDHNHVSGRVRGLLCRLCNSHLGWFENRKETILSYLEKQ